MAENAPTDFIREIVRKDLKTGKHDRIVTRFPPEPNGYLHIGHAKAFCLNFGLAEEFGGQCNLRFDDTNPDREDTEYVHSICEDLKWMGFDWGEGLYFASDYFDQLYDYALELIQQGKAYVCDLSTQEIRAYRGTVTTPGENSPYRNRTASENLALFEQMKNGAFPEGACTLRAKADMASPNMNLRDPVMYRIKHTPHHRTGDKWCIYPMYDWAHGQSDAIERITHSLCSIEFAEHRPLYDWYIQQLEIFPSRQIEFARLNITYTLTSKRLLTQLVDRGLVAGWDDPRMPTLSGMRRRGIPPQAIKNFIWRVGMNRRDTTAEIDLFEFYIREHLNEVAPRVMGVIDPLKVVIENYPEGEEETFEAMVNPEDPNAGTRAVPFSREVYIEREDFMEDPPRKFYRLAPGREVRLRAACYITCRDVVKDEEGEVIELRCTWDPKSRGGTTPDKRRVRSTLHWVSAKHAIEAEVRLFDRLFLAENPAKTEDGRDFTANLNPDSREVRPACYVEPSMKGAKVGQVVQFERLGYFCVDADSSAEKLVLNRTITLRDTWARMKGKK